MRPFAVFLVTVSVLTYWNFHPAAAAVIATVRSQDGRSKKTYVLEPIRPSVPTTPKVISDVNGSNHVSPVDQVNSYALLPSSESVNSLLFNHQFQQKGRQGKPLFVDLNVILADGSPLVLSTESPSTTTALNDHHATTMGSMDEKRTILDPFSMDPNHQSVWNKSNYGLNKESKSIWLVDDEEEEYSEESDDYEAADLSQPSFRPEVDLSIATNDELNRKEYSSPLKDDYEDNPDEDMILVMGPLSTLSPGTSDSEIQDGIEEPTPQFRDEESNPAQIGLSEWPVQVGLQARSKSSLAIKPAESPTDNLNKQKMTADTQESRGQQSKNFQTTFNSDQPNGSIAPYRNGNASLNGSDDDGDSDEVSVRPYIRSQFMHSPVVNTAPPEASETFVDTEMNHYGNPNGDKPIKVFTFTTTTSEPEKPKHYSSSQEEGKQETIATIDPDESFYYYNSEEESDHDMDLDYPEEEELIKPIAAEINTQRTVGKPQSPTGLGRPPYFVSSSVAPPQQRMDSVNDFELMNPIEMIENRMDIDSNNGIPFAEDAIQPMVVIPFPMDHVLMNQPDFVVKPQPLISMAHRPIGKTETPQKDSFLMNYDHYLPSIQLSNSGSSILSKETAKPPNISGKFESGETGGKDLVYGKPRIGSVVQEELKKSEEIKPPPIKINNTKVYGDPVLPTTHQNGLPSVKTTSSLTQVHPVNLSQPTRPMETFKSHVHITTASPIRPFLQTTYITRSTNKAGAGPYFVNPVELAYRRDSYSAKEEITKPLIENYRSSAAKREEGIIDRSREPSANAGRPPYFMTGPAPTPLHPTNGPTARPTTQGPVEKTAGVQTDDFDISFGPVRHTLPYILTRLNAAQPIEPFYPSSAASNVTERIIDIDLPTEKGMTFPNPIGISNRNNIFVVPKRIANETARTPVLSSTVPTILATSKPGSSMNNQRKTTTETIINHKMGSFIVTSSPIRTSIQPTYTSRPATVATIPTTKESNIVKPVKSEEKIHKTEVDYPAQEKIEIPTVAIQNPIGISNKDNVFIVPKSVKGIIRPPIRSNTFPTNILKRQSSGANGEQQTSTQRPFERIVSHQMGSFVVTSSPQSARQTLKTAVGETIRSSEIPETVVRSPTESASPDQPLYFSTNSTDEPIGSNRLKTGKSDQIVRSRSGIGSRNPNISTVGSMAQPSFIDRHPAGKLTTRSNINRRKQQQSRTPFQRPNRRAGKRSIVPVSPRSSHSSLTSASSNHKRKDAATKTN